MGRYLQRLCGEGWAATAQSVEAVDAARCRRVATDPRRPLGRVWRYKVVADW